jgi:hypothetical protein
VRARPRGSRGRRRLDREPLGRPLFTADDRVFLQAVVRAGYANPFSPVRVEAERAALGAFFVDLGALPAAPSNRQRIASRLRPILDAAAGTGAGATRGPARHSLRRELGATRGADADRRPPLSPLRAADVHVAIGAYFTYALARAA